MAQTTFWIARDKDGSLWLHDERPWCSTSGTWYSHNQMRIRNNDHFPDVTLANSPQQVQLTPINH